MSKDIVEPPKTKDPENSWQFKQDDTSTKVTHDLKIKDIDWTALEFIYHQKSQKWYIYLAFSTVLFSSLIYLITRDVVSTFVVIIVMVVFGVLAARKPRELKYVIDSEGVTIGGRLYPFVGFKSFALVLENETNAIWMLPLKRFKPIIPLYYSPEIEQEIVKALANILPLEEYHPDFVNQLMHRLHF